MRTASFSGILILVSAMAFGDATSSTSNSKAATSQLEPISITMDDIAESALPKIKQEKEALLKTATTLNNLPETARDTIEYAVVYDNYQRSLNAVRSHNAYAREKSITLVTVIPPTSAAVARYNAELERIEREIREEQKHRELLAKQEQQVAQQNQIIQNQASQLNQQHQMLLKQEEQIEDAKKHYRTSAIQNKHLLDEMLFLNSQVFEHNSRVKKMQEEAENSARFRSLRTR